MSIKWTDIESFWVSNQESFWVNFIVGSIFFLLSVWFVPRLTLRLIRRRNKKYLKQKISFSIQEVCDFFNHMPREFWPNETSVAIYCANIKYPKLKDFVALLKPNLFIPAAFEQMIVNILETTKSVDSESCHELIENEIKRLKVLKDALENVVGVHSNALEEEIINKISQLCLDIQITIRKHKDDDLFEELLKRKDGAFGASHLRIVYSNAFSLLDELVREKGFSIEMQLEK